MTEDVHGSSVVALHTLWAMLNTAVPALEYGINLTLQQDLNSVVLTARAFYPLVLIRRLLVDPYC